MLYFIGMNDFFGSINIIIFIPVLLFSVGIHEAMHGFAAHWLGDSTAQEQGRLTLNPLKHLDLYTSIILPLVLVLSHLPPFFVAKPVPFNPSRVKYDEFGVAIIGVTGPLTNISLAIIAAILLKLPVILGSGTMVQILLTVVIVNVSLAVFNMIPFPPLDGSRLLYAFAPEPLQRLMASLESSGFMIIIIFMVIFMSSGLGEIIVRIDNSVIRLLLG